MIPDLETALDALRRAVGCETHLEAVAAAHQAWQTEAAGCPSPLAVADLVAEVVALRDRVALSETAIVQIRQKYAETERRRLRAEAIVERIGMLAGASVVEVAAREVDSCPSTGRGM